MKSEELRKQAEALLSGDLDTNQLPDDLNLPALLHELQVFQIELQLQNEQLRKSEQELLQAHQKYMAYYQDAPVGYLILDEKGIVREANSTAYHILQHYHKRLVGHTLITQFESDMRSRFLSVLHQLQQDSKDDTQTVELQLANIPNRYVRLNFRKATTNTPHAIWVTVSDISEEMQLRQKVQATNRQLINTQQAASIGSWEYYSDTEQTIWSDELYHLLRINPNTIQPSFNKLLSFIHQDDQAKLKEDVQRSIALAEKQFENIRFQLDIRYYPHQTDTYHWASIQGYATFPPQTEQIIVSGTFQNITDRKQLEADTIQTGIEDEQHQRISAFITAMSHQFRTPLSIIQSSADLFQMKYRQDEKVTVYHDRISKSIRTLERLLDTMLIATVIAEGKLHQERPFYLSEAVHIVVDEHKRRQRKGEVVFINELSNSPEPPVIGDMGLIERVILELINNAIQHSDMNNRIEIKLSQTDYQMQLQVADAGPGIPAEILSSLKTDLNLSDLVTETQLRMGLTIVNSIIQLHKGNFDIHSDENGTYIDITLPIHGTPKDS